MVNKTKHCTMSLVYAAINKQKQLKTNMVLLKTNYITMNWLLKIFLLVF